MEKWNNQCEHGQPMKQEACYARANPAWRVHVFTGSGPNRSIESSLPGRIFFGRVNFHLF